MVKKDVLLVKIAVAVVSLAIFSLAFTILKPGLPTGHDISAHAIRAHLFIDALREGQFPVRWTGWLAYGFDHPLFNFFPVGFYYLTAGVNVVFSSLTASIKLSILLLWWLGSLLMFLYAKRFGTLPAALAALIYAFTPYLISDIFVRAAYPELAAVTFSVGTLWGLDRALVSGKRIFAVPLALFLASLIISHMPTLVIISPLLLSYILLLFFSREATLTGLKTTAISLALGFGMSAFYFLPAILELDLVKSSLLSSFYYDFHIHFIYLQQIFSTFWGYGTSVAGPNDGMSFQFGVFQWVIITLAIGTAALKKRLKLNRAAYLHLIFWLTMLLYSVFFIHGTSLSFWENIKPLSFIQYPWRFLMVVILACPPLAAILLERLHRQSYQIWVIFLSLAVVVILYHGYLHPAAFLPDGYFNLDSPDWKQSQGVAQGANLEEGYLPKEVEELPQTTLPRWEAATDQKTTSHDQILEKDIRSHDLIFLSQSQNSFLLRVNTHFFPGWKAYVDNQETAIEHDNRFDFINITIPPGIHRIEVKFTDTLIRSLANKVTILSLLILILWQIRPLYQLLRFKLQKLSHQS